MSKHDLEYEHPTNCICPECKSENWYEQFDDTDIVQRAQALGVDPEERDRAISSLRWAVDYEDYDQLMAMGDLSGADVWAEGSMNL